MKWIAPVVALALVVAACGATAAVDAPASTPSAPGTTPASASTSVAPPREIRVLVLGDSYAAGEGVDPDDAWPAQLTASLAGENVTAEVEVIGRAGWTSQRVAAELDREGASGPYDLVFIGVGSNDHFNQFGTAHLQGGIDQLLEQTAGFVTHPGAVVLLSIVDWRVTPRGLEYAGSWRSGALAPYNEILAATANDGGHRFIDVTAVSLAQADDPSLTNDDGFHASGALYRRWVELMLPAVLDAIG